MNSILKVAVIDPGRSEWTAGSTYTRLVATTLGRAASEAKLSVCYVSRQGVTDIPGVASMTVPEVAPLPGESFLRSLVGRKERHYVFPRELQVRRLAHIANAADALWAAARWGADVVLPLIDPPPLRFRPAAIGWVPDFQHRYLPQFFSHEELVRRERATSRLMQRTDAIMLSSHTALQHLLEVDSDAELTTRVVPFPSQFGIQPPVRPGPDTATKYNLPERFGICINQFWRHKNHLTLVEAIGRLRLQGTEIPVVLVGTPQDSRTPDNRPVSEVLQAIARHDVRDLVTVLGHVPRDELVALLRQADFVVQPSLFEGWNTTIEDAKALGKAIICSDIPIHREQAPDAHGYFPAQDATALAALLASTWAEVDTRRCTSEAAALTEASRRAETYGKELLNLLNLAVNLHKRRWGVPHIPGLGGAPQGRREAGEIHSSGQPSQKSEG